MSKKYTQLTEAERYYIYTMKKQGYSNTAIAQGMRRERTTVRRELQRHTDQRGDHHQQEPLSRWQSAVAGVTWPCR